MKLKLTLLLLIVFQFNFSQETTPIIKVNKNDISYEWENWTEKVPISGNVRVGLMANQVSEGSFKPLNFYVSLPDISKQIDLCVELSSKDGRYSGKLCFAIGPLERKVYKIEIPTEYQNELSKFKTEEVVILASLNKNAVEKPEAYVISSWSDFEIKGINSLDVYLNSLMPTKIALKSEGKPSAPIDCKFLIQPTVAYNKKCHIENFENLDDSSYIQINQRRKRGSTVKIVNYKIPLRF